MEKINGIIENGKVYVAENTEEESGFKCDLVEEDGTCLYRDFCVSLGRLNIFRYSPELTDKINKI